MRCGITGKRVFKSHEAALTRGGEILCEDSNRRFTPKAFRAYHCVYCGFYHLSGVKPPRVDKVHFQRNVPVSA